MKYNKQLSDQITKEYEQLMNLAEFVYDQMLEKDETLTRFEILSNFDIYAQSLLTKIALEDNPKNPALFNMIKKLTKYASFYQGINVDEWFSDKTKVLNKINDKIEAINNNIPHLIKISKEADIKSRRTELSYQLLEGLIGLIMSIKSDAENFEEVEELILNNLLKNIYEYINK